MGACSKEEEENKVWAYRTRHEAFLLLEVPATTDRPRLERLDAICRHYKIKPLDASVLQDHFQHQRVLCTYTRSDKLPVDRNILGYANSNMANRVYDWHPTNSVVVQVSKNKQRVFNSIQTRHDQAVRRIGPTVLQELYEWAATLKPEGHDLIEPYSFEEVLPKLKKQGAAGIFEKYANMQACLDDADTPQILTKLFNDLYSGKTSDMVLPKLKKQGAAGIFEKYANMQACLDDADTPQILTKLFNDLYSGKTSDMVLPKLKKTGGCRDL